VPRALALGLVLALFLIGAGCGGDDQSDDDSPSGQIETTIKTWLTSGGCEYMTDEFLESQTFIDDPEEACDAHENLFEEPGFSEDDIIVSDIAISGKTATAIVSDDFSNVETTYRLKLDGGTWMINSTDIN
jgi:hypothetical protein